jgi:phosphate starvation-inducible PhoH-like protein
VSKKKSRRQAELIQNASDVSSENLNIKNTKDTSPYVPQRDKINFQLNIAELPWTEKQKAFIELVQHKDTKIVFLSGPAGTSKSILAVYTALKLLNEKKISEIIYIRSIIESASKSLGSLPGEADDKFRPFAAPLLDKLEELLRPPDVKRLLLDNRVKPVPVNYLRGASYNVNFVIADEMQNAEFSEIQTIITRIGHFSKFVFCGDPMQTDLKEKHRSGFKQMFDLFNCEESQQQGIYCIEFGKEDIMRSGILKYIIEKLEQAKNITLPNK